MKRVALTGFMASILMATGAAFAAVDDSSLTTKKYVDDGLRYVYGRADNTYTKSETYTQAEVNAELAKKANAADIVTYTSEQDRGVKVDNTNHTIGLDFGNSAPETDKSYVFKNGAWVALQTANDWKPEYLNEPSQNPSPEPEGT